MWMSRQNTVQLLFLIKLGVGTFYLSFLFLTTKVALTLKPSVRASEIEWLKKFLQGQYKNKNYIHDTLIKVATPYDSWTTILPLPIHFHSPTYSWNYENEPYLCWRRQQTFPPSFEQEHRVWPFFGNSQSYLCLLAWIQHLVQMQSLKRTKKCAFTAKLEHWELQRDSPTHHGHFSSHDAL